MKRILFWALFNLLIWCFKISGLDPFPFGDEPYACLLFEAKVCKIGKRLCRVASFYWHLIESAFMSL